MFSGKGSGIVNFCESKARKPSKRARGCIRESGWRKKVDACCSFPLLKHGATDGKQ